MTSWLVPFAGQKIPVQPGWYLPLLKNLLAGNRFIQAGKGAENTKEKSRQCFLHYKNIQESWTRYDFKKSVMSLFCDLIINEMNINILSSLIYEDGKLLITNRYV